MNKNNILFIHPIVGVITINDVTQDLNLAVDDLNLFKSIIGDILNNHTSLSNEDISSLTDLLPIDKLNWIIDLLQTINEK